jgi:hypothetical protein
MSYMKKILYIAAAFAALMTVPWTGRAFSTAQGVTATPITVVPFTITAPGNYFLPADLAVPAGIGISVNADQVVIDLNGRSLNGTGGTIGIAISNHKEVTVQNGDINNFSAYGVYLFAGPGGSNQKNAVRNVNFNGAGNVIGIVIIGGINDVVEHCNSVGGFAAVYDIGGTGDRFQADNSEGQQFGIVSVASPSGNLIEDCLFTNETILGFFAGNPGDKFRFDTAINTTLHVGGINLLADSF